MINKLALIQKLDTLAPSDLVGVYQKVFSDVEGELVLIDLMMRFGEFKPATNLLETGQSSVLIYIKNRLLGIVEQPIPQGEINDE